MTRTNRRISTLLLFTFFWGMSAIAFAQDDVPDTDIKSVSIGDLGASAAGSTSPTGTKRPPRVGPNIRANAAQQAFPNGLLGRSETTVTSTSDGQSIIVGFNDAQGFCGSPFGVACTPQSPPGLSGFAFATDGGLTFTDGGAPDPALFSNVFTRGDPWLDRGGFDNLTFYFANLSVDATTGADLGVSVHRGHFSGSSFAWEDVRVFNAPNAPDDFYDKEAIATDKDLSGAGYVSLTNFIKVCNVPQAGFGQIEVWRTHDAGATWSGPVIVSADKTDITDPNNPACGAGGVLQQSSAPAIGPKGEVYVAWQLGPHLGPTGTTAQIVVARSLDGGVTFNTPVVVASINTMRNDPPVGYNRDRINDHPRVAVATPGFFKGRVYVTFYSAVDPVTAGAISAAGTTSCPSPPIPAKTFCRAQRLTSSNVFVTFSDDLGGTWSTPVAVGGLLASGSTGVKRWWPVVNVEPGGTIDVVYYESQETTTASNAVCTINVGGGIRRRGTANSLVNTFWAQSVDGGSTFGAPIQMTTATSNWCTAASNVRPNFGDYIGATFGGNRVLATWGDGRNGVPDTFYATGLGAGKSQ
ncbi:MAG TPA: hypothetical protein VEV41_11180 [Terriglobales bacterium]|nr:hypothetical protein [Terriglobales bacterium]